MGDVSKEELERLALKVWPADSMPAVYVNKNGADYEVIAQADFATWDEEVKVTGMRLEPLMEAAAAALRVLAKEPTIETKLRELAAKWRERVARVEKRHSAQNTSPPGALWGLEIAAEELEALLNGGL